MKRWALDVAAVSDGRDLACCGCVLLVEGLGEDIFELFLKGTTL